MGSATVAVVDYGMGNLHSVARALTKVGAEVIVTDAPAEGLGNGIREGMIDGKRKRNLHEPGFVHKRHSAMRGYSRSSTSQ